MQLVRNLELERDVKFIQMVLYAIMSYLGCQGCRYHELFRMSRMSGY